MDQEKLELMSLSEVMCLLSPVSLSLQREVMFGFHERKMKMGSDVRGGSIKYT